MKIRKIAFFAVIGVLCISMLAVKANVQADATGTLKEIQDRGYLIVGSDLTYPPFEELNATTNVAEGFDIDLAHQMAIALGVDLEVKDSDWDPIIPNLKAAQFDVIISAMTITAAREEQVDFTRWYYKSSQAILVPVANPLAIDSASDLNATIEIGVQSGTTSDIWVQDNLNTSVTLTTFETILQAIAALKLGTIDVVLGDFAVLAQDEAESAATKVVGYYSPEDFGFAVRSGDTDLLAALNTAINTLLGSNVNSPSPNDLYNTMYYKWFGVMAGDVGYTGSVINAEIVHVWRSTAAPGFELVALLAAFIAIPIFRKIRK